MLPFIVNMISVSVTSIEKHVVLRSGCHDGVMRSVERHLQASENWLV